MMIFNFSSEEVTKAWWADTKYQKLSALRHAATGMEFQRGWYIFEIGFWRICADTVTPARRRSPARICDAKQGRKLYSEGNRTTLSRKHRPAKH